MVNKSICAPIIPDIVTDRQVRMRVLDLLLCWTSASMAAVPVILDTDMDFDVDDVGALCVLHALQVWEKSIRGG